MSRLNDCEWAMTIVRACKSFSTRATLFSVYWVADFLSEGEERSLRFRSGEWEARTFCTFIFDSDGRTANSFGSCSCRLIFFLYALRFACVLSLQAQCLRAAVLHARDSCLPTLLRHHIFTLISHAVYMYGYGDTLLG
jgi:hypothetical protein